MITPMDEMIESLEARINLLLDFPANRPLGMPQDQRVESLSVSLEDLKTAAAENSPMVKEASLMIEEEEKMVAFARKELSPNFVVGAGWEFKGRLPSMYEVMVGFEIPLYRRTKQSKMLEESLVRVESSKSGLVSAKNDLIFMITENYLKARSAESLVRLYKEAIIPQASLTVESSLASYQVNKTDFLALLTDINTHFSYQMAYYGELAELWGSIARLEESSAREIVNWGGTHEDVSKIAILSLAATAVILAASCKVSSQKTAPAAATGQEHAQSGQAKPNSGAKLYNCPMHPTYVSDKPGDCPICGMKLVPIEPQGTPAEAPAAPPAKKKTLYRSTMMPNEISDKPGKDSMGMEMVPFEVEEAGQSPKSAGGSRSRSARRGSSSSA